MSQWGTNRYTVARWILTQTAKLQTMHAEMNKVIIKQHGVTRIDIIEEIQITEQSIEASKLVSK